MSDAERVVGRLRVPMALVEEASRLQSTEHLREDRTVECDCGGRRCTARPVFGAGGIVIAVDFECEEPTR